MSDIITSSIMLKWAFTVFAVVLAVFLMRRRKQNKKNRDGREEVDGFVPSPPHEGRMYNTATGWQTSTEDLPQNTPEPVSPHGAPPPVNTPSPGNKMPGEE